MSGTPSRIEAGHASVVIEVCPDGAPSAAVGRRLGVRELGEQPRPRCRGTSLMVEPTP